MRKGKIKERFLTYILFLLIFTLVFIAIPIQSFASLNEPIKQGKSNRIKVKNVLPKGKEKSEELKTRRKQFSKEYINPDGTFTVEVFNKPISYRDKSNKWREIDNTLTQAKKQGYKYENKKNSFKVSFAEENQSNKLVHFSIDDDHWVSFSPIDKFTVRGTAKNSTMEYKNIKPGMDLIYTLDSNRLKEEIILKKYPKTNKFTFELESNGISFEKDDNGLLWAKSNKTGDRLFCFQKSFAEDKNGEITYETDLNIVNENGLRTKKAVEGGKTERYYYNRGDLAYITDNNNTLKYFFVRDTSGRLLNMIDYTGTPETYWYLYDAFGSIVGLADKTGQEVVTYDYDAWGRVTGYTNTVYTGNGEELAKANPFRYRGYQYDEETKLYYLKNRYYSPSIGRFLTKDAVFSNNLYMYANNNPVNYLDSNGYHPILIIGEKITVFLPQALNEMQFIVYQYGPQISGAIHQFGPNIVELLVEMFYKGTSKVFGSRETEALLDGVSGISGSNRERLLSAVQNGDLKSIVNELYRPGATLGDGGTASALAQEFYEGSSKHLQKAKDRLRQLNNLAESGNLGLNDLDIVDALRMDLENSIKLFD